MVINLKLWIFLCSWSDSRELARYLCGQVVSVSGHTDREHNPHRVLSAMGEQNSDDPRAETKAEVPEDHQLCEDTSEERQQKIRRHR